MTQRRTAGILLFAGLIYFSVFILANRLGAADVDMLAVFEIDEYAQYPFLAPMLSGGESARQAIRNFLVYGHYFYGYPFYFFSAAVLLPMRLAVGADWSAQTQTAMLLLRQMVNVLPNMLSAYALAFFATRFRSFWKSAVVFSLLLVTPALVNNSFWWHPDGLGLLFASLAFVSLLLDEMRFGRYFILCAVFVGIAAGIKYLGFFFFLTIPAYLGLGVMSKNISWRTAVCRALLFLAVMFSVIVITNPLLLLPLERSELVAAQLQQFSRVTAGELMGKQPFLDGGKLPNWLTTQYGCLPYLLLCAGALVSGLLNPNQRLKALLVATFILPLGIVTFQASLQRTHYWLPVFLPLTTSLAFILPDQLPKSVRKPALWLFVLAAGIITIQAGAFMRTDISRYDEMLRREEFSPSLSFYEKARRVVADARPVGRVTRVYRDWKIYFPAEPQVSVFMDWELASYGLISETQPDILMLERANVQTYGAGDFLSRSADPVRLAPMQRFYANALHNEIEGFKLVYEDSFGMVFQKIEPGRGIP